MKFRKFHIILSLSVFVSLTASESIAQQGDLSARESVGLVSSQFGPRATRWLVELRGNSGVPQPADWEILALDENAPKLLRRYWAGGGRAGDNGPDGQRYPLDLPIGYFSMNMVGVDSVAAFTIAEGEARKAKMGFDSCNYLLRVREFTNETIWRLELLDAARQIVGKVYISGTSGQVLRTVWVYSGDRARADGLPLIIDSAMPRGDVAPPTTGITSIDTTYRDPVPGHTGIAGAPDMVNPQQPAAPRPYAPVPADSLSGTVAQQPAAPAAKTPAPTAPRVPTTEDRQMMEIPPPAPPASSSSSAAAGTTASSGGTAQQPFRDLRDPPATQKPDPAKPPIEVPEGSSGSGGRIPPPPIPQ